MIKVAVADGNIEVEKILWGSFIEQMGRAIYGGIYDKEHSLSDENGFRQDVKDAVKELNVPIIRYPGGNFVSGYDWRDGVGGQRPTRLNLAWQQLEPNAVGLHEFYDWCVSVGAEMMMAINLGTGTIKDALELVEYCIFAGDTTIANERRKNGREQPFPIKYWCLGNEMDGIWQICNLPAEEYARKAREVSKLIKIIDPEIKTTLVGSSAPYLPTYPEWEKKVLDEAYEFVDYISLHRYYETTEDGKLESYIGQYKDLEKYIHTVRDIVIETKERKNSSHNVYLALDEWNIWKKENDSSLTKWLISDKRVENTYDFADAVLMSNMIITMAQNGDYLKIGCLAQLVNVIAPIMTENGGRMFLQTTYYPYRFAAKHLTGILAKCDYHCPTLMGKDGEYESLNMVAVRTETGYSVMIVNNSFDKEQEVALRFPQKIKAKTCKLMHAQPNAVNSFEEPNKVIPVDHACAADLEGVKILLPAFSILTATFTV